MGDMHPAQLHKLMRTWLLSEDPYGLNQRQEPTFDTPQSQVMGQMNPPAGDNPSIPQPTRPRSPAARAAGESAVDKALKPTTRGEGEHSDRAQAWGTQAVDKAINAPNVQSEAFQGERNPRAQAWGTEAVGEATAKPAPLPMNAPGWASPEEAQAWASGVGQSAVERALATKSRARGKLQPSLPSEED